MLENEDITTPQMNAVYIGYAAMAPVLAMCVLSPRPEAASVPLLVAGCSLLLAAFMGRPDWMANRAAAALSLGGVIRQRS